MWTLRRIAREISEIFLLIMIVFTVRTVLFSLYKVPSGSMETTMLVGEYYFADKLTYWFRPPRRGEIIAFNEPGYVYSQNPLMKKVQQYCSIPPIWPLWCSQYGPENWTKRVVGVPGDHVKGVVEDGVPVVYINGERFYEPYINQYPLVKVMTLGACSRGQRRSLGRGGMPPIAIHPCSYDPSVSFDKQPFYFLEKETVLKDNDGKIILTNPGRALPDRPDVRIGTDQDYWNGSDNFNVHLGPDQYWAMGDNRLGSSDSRFFGPVSTEMIHARIIWRIGSIDSGEHFWPFLLLKHPIDFFTHRVRWSRFFAQLS